MVPVSAQPASKPVGRRDRRKAEVRARIIDASLELFSKQDYVDTTVEQITEAADVGKGTFFNYFDCKEQVLSGLSVRQLARIEDAVDQAIRDERPAKETLRRLLHLTADTPGKSRTLMRNLLVGNFSSEQSSDYLREYVEQALGAVQELLRWARERGEVVSTESVESQARRFIQVYMGVTMMWVIQPGISLHEWLDVCITHYWQSIAADGGKQM
ncbi:MAG: hypothetical protein AMXMBFR82_45340 [Candidatus Hydrogenedentota bacterium]